MKASLLLLLACVSTVSMANDKHDEAAQQQPAVENYNYSMKLDIAKVISVSDDQAACSQDPVPVRMNYLDSAGASHTLEYLTPGTGCSNN